MKTFAVILIIVAGSTKILSQDAVPGRLIWSSINQTEVLSDIPPPVGIITSPENGCALKNINERFCNDITDEGNNCLSTGINYCLKEPVFVKCGGSFPYCVESVPPGQATCESQPKAGLVCPAPPSNFDCTGVGIFPDPLNCRRYQECSEIDDPNNPNAKILAAKVHECPNLYAYDPALPKPNRCRFTNNNAAYCIQSDCKDSLGLQVLRYKYFSAALGQIGVMCLGSPNIPPRVYKCGPYQTLETDKFNPGCILTCIREGQKAAYKKNNQMYYQCYRGPAGLYPNLRPCFNREIFDAEKLECVAQAQG